MEKIRVGIAGAGSVAGCYLEFLQGNPRVELVGICDIVEERARQRAEQFGVPRAYPDVDALLGGPEFDLLLNATSMPAHVPVNRRVLEAGRHVYSEKPFAPTLTQGQELIELARRNGVRLWAAPTAILSPQFRCMAETVARGELGTVYAAHACYGHGGPSWGPWFYREGGGCIFDLAVYNITTLTGLLGPARAVAALTGVCIPERTVEGERVRVEAEDHAMIVLDHGNGVFSHIQSGFVYGAHNFDRTIEAIGTKGAMNLGGWDWCPTGVRVSTDGGHTWEERCPDSGGYAWQNGIAHFADCLLEGKESPMRIEHALHVVEAMAAAHESARTGRRIAVESGFPWPIY
jgi:predicted dehydrogenase